MGLQVVGAGLGRTGTMSLKIALERLLGGPCYHMAEVFQRPADAPVWHRAFLGDEPDWSTFLADYRAAVDWPASGLWSSLAAAFPDALVLLSEREPDAWWTSASNTIFGPLSGDEVFEGPSEWVDMANAMMEAFSPDWQDETAAKAAFVAHNQRVRDEVPADRLLIWTAADGWEPICAALELPVPDEPFPHANTTEEFQARSAQRRS